MQARTNVRDFRVLKGNSDHSALNEFQSLFAQRAILSSKKPGERKVAESATASHPEGDSEEQRTHSRSLC